MRSPKFYKLIIAALLILNIGTLAFFWLSKPAHPPKPGERPHLSEKIGLTGEHKKKVDALEKEHHKLKRALVRKDVKLHEELYNNVGKDIPTAPLLEEIDENKEEIEKMTIEFFNEVATHCDDKQKKSLRKFVRRLLHHLRLGGPKRHGGPKGPFND